LPWAFLTPRASPFGFAQCRLPRRIFFEVEFLIFSYRKYHGENRISLNTIEKQPKTYINPILVALGYQEALDSQKYKNQTELAKSLNVTRSRVNQYLRLLKLPDGVQESIRSGSFKHTERGLRRMKVLL